VLVRGLPASGLFRFDVSADRPATAPTFLAGVRLVLAVFIRAVAPKLPIPGRWFGSPERLWRRPAGHSCTGSSKIERTCVLRNGPAAGHCRGLADRIARRSPFNVALGDAPATLLGFWLTTLRSFDPATARVVPSFGGCFPLPWLRSHVPLSLAPPADVFGVRHRCRGPAPGYERARADQVGLRLLGFGPAGQPIRCIVAAPPRLGYEGPPSIHANHYCPGLLLFRVSRPSNSGTPLLGPIRSWALSSRRTACCATA
jgi:hypothetical protein